TPLVLHISTSCILLPVPYFHSFFFTHPAPPALSPLSLHDALPIYELVVVSGAHALPVETVRSAGMRRGRAPTPRSGQSRRVAHRSEEHTSELQSLTNLVCRLLLEKKKKSANKSTVKIEQTITHSQD